LDAFCYSRGTRNGAAVTAKRCAACGRFYAADPRVVRWQKTCGRATCKQANKQRQEDAWRERSREHLRVYYADQREMRRDDLRAYHRAYYHEHRDEIRGRQKPYQRGYRRDNRGKLTAKQRARYWRDPRARKKQMRDYRIQNRAKLTAYQRQRRQVIKLLPGISPEQINKLRKASAK